MGANEKCEATYHPNKHNPMEESELMRHARRELTLIGVISDDPNSIDSMMRKIILELVEVFSKQGHSGFSASMAIDLTQRLLRYEALTPLTNAPDEWNEIAENYGGPNLWQSRRQSEAFSHDGGRTYYLLAEKRKWTSWLYWKLPQRLRIKISANQRLTSRLLYPFHTSALAASGHTPSD